MNRLRVDGLPGRIVGRRFWAWTDNNGHPEDAVSWQKILDEISGYWFTASATSSARLYWESFADKVTAPSGLSVRFLFMNAASGPTSPLKTFHVDHR